MKKNVDFKTKQKKTTTKNRHEKEATFFTEAVPVVCVCVCQCAGSEPAGGGLMFCRLQTKHTHLLLKEKRLPAS